MNKLFWILVLSFLSNLAFANDLEEGKVYRLQKTVHDIELARDTSQKFIVVTESKFRVVDASDTNHYVVKFITLYNRTTNDGTKIKSTVNKQEEYLLPRAPHNIPIEKSTVVSRGGAVSGPLIVPFKYRLDDDSLTGDAAIGFYAGYSFEPRIIFTDTRVPVTPFIAGGLSQVSVTEDEDTTNQTGVTLAIGILIQNWDGVNIGFVYGQDRIGNKDWEHEGEDWLSFMVGWEL